MLEIKFHDREKEIQEIMRILNSRPDLITFVYGPINSGKSSLMCKIAEELGKDYVVFYVDLRERFVKNYDDFVRVLFKVHRSKVKDYKAFLAKVLEGFNFEGLPIPKNLLIELLKSSDVEDVFEYIITVFETVREKRKTPILILDELQVIGDLKINDLLIYRLFNLFVSITKKRHLAHVFAITSDSLFIERVYSEAMLHGRCRYLLIDDFNYNTTKEFLEKYGFSQEEIDLTWNYLGGKPVYLVEAIKNKDRLKEFCEESLEDRFNFILYRVNALKRKNPNLFEKVITLFKAFENEDKTECYEISDEVIWTVKNNILFLDPRKRLLKPQSRLDLLAVRKIFKKVTAIK